jgi:hypothetical protein
MRRFALALLVFGLAGFLWALRLPEERKNRMNKLIREAKEMPFRLFV